MTKLILFVVGVGLLFVGFRAYPLLATLPGPLSALVVVPKEGYMGLGGLLAILSGVWSVLGFFRKRPTQKWSTQRQFVPVKSSDEDEQDKEGLPRQTVPVRREVHREKPRSTAKKGGFFGLSWMTVIGVTLFTILILVALLQLGGSETAVAPAQVQSQAASVEEQKVKTVVPSTEKRVVLNVGAAKYTGPNPNNLAVFLTEATKLGEVSQEEINIALAQNGFLVTKEYPNQNAIEVYIPSCEQNCAEGPATVLTPFGYPFEQVPVEVKPTPRPVTKQVSAQIIPENKFSPLWQLFLPMAVIVVFWLLIWYIWIAITKPQLVEAWEFEMTFKGGGGATLEIRPTLKQIPEPGAIARARQVGPKEAKKQLRTTLEDMVSGTGGRATVFETNYDNALRVWQDELNQTFARREAGQPYDTDFLLRLEQKEASVGMQVVTLDFSELEYDGQALTMLQEEADRRRRKQEATVSTGYLQYCFANGLTPQDVEVFKTWAEMEMRQLDARVRDKEAQAQLVRAQALSELAEELSPEDIFRSIERIIAGAIGGRSRGGGVGRALQNMLAPSGRKPAGEEV